MKTSVRISAVCLAFALILLIVSGVDAVKRRRDDEAAAESFLRLHVRAASDSDSDQALKLRVRDTVLAFTTSLLDGVEDKQQAIDRLGDNLPLLETLCEETVRENGSEDAVSVRLDREAFDYREYDGFYLPEGEYDSLIVEIGGGKGHNWWCVIFPAVCLSGACGEIRTDTSRVPARFRLSDNVRTGQVVYDLWIVRVIKNLFA